MNVREVRKELDELLRRWDAGEPVQTVEMGGLSDGYERAIQTHVFEIVRAYNTDDRRLEEAAKRLEGRAQQWWDKFGEDVRPAEGASGAMVGAAKSLAAAYLRNGHAGALAMVEADRHIEVVRR